jgi:hypothetical protein
MVFSLQHDIKVTKNHQNLLPTQSVLVAHTVLFCTFEPVEGYGGSTAYAGNVNAAARRETCAETFYDAF